MRNDFDKVLTDDPRRGSHWKFSEIRRAKGNASFDDEFSGGKESMMKRRRFAKGDRKSFGDHLNPLCKFIATQVGKNWNSVYSEICRLFDRRGQTNMHVHQHVFDNFVEIKTCLVDGKVCFFSSWGGWREIITSYSRRSFYVHPISGVLCTSYLENEPGHAAKIKIEQAMHRDAKFRVHNADEHLFLENGVWVLYKLVDRPTPNIEYHCPIWWTGFERLRWEKMTIEDRKREGKAVLVYSPIIEVKAPLVPYGGKRWETRDTTPANRYYALKQVAGRRYLKAHGLVGTAPGAPMKANSHREASKYRSTNDLKLK